MKKTIISSICIIALVFSVFAFASCVDETPPENNDPQSYKVSMADDPVFGDYYTLTTDKSVTMTGNTVTVSVNDLWDFLSVDKVYANDVECTPADDGKYTFTMPDKDVEVKATFKVNVITELDDGMKWQNKEEFANPTTLSGGIGVEFGSKPILNSVQSNPDGYSTMTYAKVISTNQDVVPDEAITRIAPETGSNGAYAISAWISFDVTKVSSGKTTLIFIDTDNDRAISIEVTVI